MNHALFVVIPFAIAAVLLLPCASASVIYNYEAYGNTLAGPLEATGTGICTAQSYVSATFSESNCSPAAGVLASADALSTFTQLHADSSLVLNNATLPAGITASGYARTVDSAIVGTPSVAYLGFTFMVDGTLSNSGLTNAHVTMNFGFAYDSGFAGQAVDGCVENDAGGSTAFAFTCSTRLYPIALFQQNTYWFSVSAQESLAPSAVPVSGSASADFSDTVTLASVQPYDINMQFIPGAIVSSTGNNGVAFADAVATPEPASLGLFAGGLALVVLLLRKRDA